MNADEGQSELAERALKNARRVVDKLNGWRDDLARLRPDEREGVEKLQAAADAASHLARLLEPRPPAPSDRGNAND